MEAKQFMELYDSYWFETEIFNKQRNPSTSHQNPDPQIEAEAAKMEFSGVSNTLSRSMSDQLWPKTSFSMSPDSVLFPAKLQTILSGKEIADGNSVPIQISPRNSRGRTRRKKKLSKSLSELEFEEVKGFMDLGFVFSEEDKDDSSLVSMIPGLQRLGKKEEEIETETEIEDGRVARRPYLSEAWEVLEEKKKKEEPLMNWRIPSVSNEIDMKDKIRFWAQTVASAVR